MTSSSKVIKAGQQMLGRQRVAVEVPIFEGPVDLAPEAETAFGEIVERAKREARAIIEQAEMDAEALLKAARDDGYRQGHEAGHEAGRQEARTSWDQLRQSIEAPIALLQQSREYLSRLNDESTIALAAALSMAVFTQLKLERLDVIKAYIEELAGSVDGQKVAVFLDPSWGPRLRALEEVLQDSVRSLAVAVDDALTPGTMRAESEWGGVLGGPLLSLQALLQEVLG